MNKVQTLAFQIFMAGIFFGNALALGIAATNPAMVIAAIVEVLASGFFFWLALYCWRYR